MERNGQCCFCGKPYSDYGNNPAPVDMRENARCCNECNANIVIPARIEFDDTLKLDGEEAAGLFLALTRTVFCKEQ